MINAYLISLTSVTFILIGVAADAKELITAGLICIVFAFFFVR